MARWAQAESDVDFPRDGMDMHEQGIYQRSIVMREPEFGRSDSLYGLINPDEPHFNLPSISHDDEELRDNNSSGMSAGSGGRIPSKKGGSLVDQVLAVLGRTATQRLREPVTLLLDMLVPITFAMLTMAFYYAFGTTPVDESHPLSHDLNVSLDTPAFIDVYQSLVCYENSTVEYTGLNKCVSNYRCDGDDTGIPIQKLCYDASVSGMDIVYMFIGSLLTSPTAIPSIDTIMIYQWLTRKTRNVAPEAGFNPNAPENVILPKTPVASLSCSGQLLFTPDTPEVQRMVTYFRANSNFFDLIFGGVRPSLKEAQRVAQEGPVETWAIIEVREMSTTAFDVSLHLNNSALPLLSSPVDPGYGGAYNFGNGDLLVASGFLSIQKMVSEFYLSDFLGATPASMDMQPYVMSMGTLDYVVNELLYKTVTVVAYVIVISFLFPVTMLVTRIVLEKELRIREAMLIMGLSEVPLYMSWFLMYMMQCIVLCAVMCVIFKLSVLQHTNPFIVFLVMFIFSMSTASLSGLIASFFSKSRIATLITPLIYLVVSLPYFAIENSAQPIVIAFSLLSPTAFGYTMTGLIQREPAGGISMREFRSPLFQPTLAVTMGLMVADFVIYFILMLYFDAVLPQDWGTPKHPLFFIIDPIKWFTSSSKDEHGGPDGRAEDGVFEDTEDNSSVQIVGLRKEFKRGGKTFVAVNNLYWSMADNSVSVLLGHNGAGKSTTMNMMTGMLVPDEGDCYIFGLSIRNQLDAVRQEVGFCPQHNILWPDLTCREHLEFFAKIKGLKGAELEDAVTEILIEVDLYDKRGYRSRMLSGGQKRKLSVAIAFVGRSRLVFLDEPTAGMDVAARRHTWELLRRMAYSHSILLTTHYMDEADLLGHRIGIMSNGRLKCSGSSLFLKSRLGVGYNLALSVDLATDPDLIGDLVAKYVPKAEVLTQHGSEITYRLPKEEVDAFPNLLLGIEESSVEMGVRGYSLSATTLEEVFLKVALADHAMNAAATSDEIEDLIFNSSLLTDSFQLTWMQFRAMMVKRFWNAFRDRKMQCFQVVCPVVCIMISMLLGLINFQGAQSALLNSSYYGESTSIEINGCDRLFGTASVDPLATYVHKINYYDTENVAWYLLDNWFNRSTPVFGAISCDDSNLMLNLVSAGGLYAPTQTPSVVLYNISSYLEAAIGVTRLYDTISRRYGGSPVKYTMEVLPKRPTETRARDSIKIILVGSMLMIPFTFLPSNPVAWIVKERQCKALHLQNICGLQFFTYWATNYIFDMAAFIITMILVIIIFVIFKRSEFVSKDNVGPTTLLLLVYGFTSTAMSYMVSFLFNDAANAQIIVLAICFVFGFLLVMLVFILSILPSTQSTSDMLRWFFRLFPPYSVGEGIINLSMLPYTKDISPSATSWDMDIIVWPCVYMIIELPLFMLFTLFFDHPKRRTSGQRISYHPNAEPKFASGEDTDVEAERENVRSYNHRMHKQSIPVLVKDLHKRYDNGKVAVKNLCFGVMPGEVFGFLGTNGAGKTTTISILCQEFLPSSGCAYICGYDIVKQSREALQCIGYCPQFDACLDLLTVREHLNLFASVRGIIPEQAPLVIEGLMSLCGLKNYQDTVSQDLSGGNRRKLSVAMSLIGGPRVVFLDEPSAGMDPVARRGLWTTIERIASNCSVVLTTHHLEEVEALADCVAIMVAGGLRCIGNKTHLKNKYGSGFEMSIRIDNVANRATVEEFITGQFPDAKLNEFRGQRFVYALPPDTKLSEAFAVLQQYKQTYGITDYSVSQTSIEQVFLRISEEEETRNA